MKIDLAPCTYREKTNQPYRFFCHNEEIDAHPIDGKISIQKCIGCPFADGETSIERPKIQRKKRDCNCGKD